MKRSKVLIIDDSAFMRKVISDIVNRSEYLEVIGTARNGTIGLEKVLELKPDVVTLDVEMPETNGLETLEKIMDQQPTPVIMLSSTTKDGAETTIESLRKGAVDFVSKPSGSISLDIHKIETEIQEKILRAASVPVDKIQNKTTQTTIDRSNRKNLPILRYQKSIIAVGVSTGGPKALQQFITKLPKVLHAPMIIVQHMPAKFTRSLANRLNELSSIEVREASNGEVVRNGIVYIAPGDFHLTIRKIGRVLVFETNQMEPERGHRPSVNVLFNSVAALNNINKIAVVLTGMGSDGTVGAQKLKQSDPNSVIIAESERTALIYGMPKSIVENVEGHYVRPLDEMASTLSELVDQ